MNVKQSDVVSDAAPLEKGQYRRRPTDVVGRDEI